MAKKEAGFAQLRKRYPKKNDRQIYILDGRINTNHTRESQPAIKTGVRAPLATECAFRMHHLGYRVKFVCNN